jgi:transketolase
MPDLQKEIDNYPIHESMRGYFGYSLFKEMATHERVWLILPDLGYKLFDKHLECFPERTLRCGASEQAAIGIAVGLALEGRIPFVYSITPFLIYRGFEWIRNYLEHERIGVKLVGSGIEDDYKHDGFTHHCPELMKALDCFPHVGRYFPAKKEQIPTIVSAMVNGDGSDFIALRR